jgi:mannose-6-phosphate isomerase-like protein (cupin superfamily)
MTAVTHVTVVDLASEAAGLAPGLPSRTIARINESCLKLSVYSGEGEWHAHPTSDELFVVLEGELRLDIFEGSTLAVGPRQVATVPAGVVHRPHTTGRAVILCFKHAAGETSFYELEDAADEVGEPATGVHAGRAAGH